MKFTGRRHFICQKCSAVADPAFRKMFGGPGIQMPLKESLRGGGRGGGRGTPTHFFEHEIFVIYIIG